MTEEYFKVLAAVAPAIVLAAMTLRKDQRPEPARWLGAAVGLGVGVGGAVLLLCWLVLPDIPVDTFMGAFLSSFLDAAIPEEGLKFAALWFLASRCKHFDEAYDGIVYAVCIGMGFASLENVLYLFSADDEWAVVGISRALMAVPAHYFFAIIMGAFFSIGWFDKRHRRACMCAALLLPIIAHGLYDTLCFSIGLDENFSFYILIAFLLGFGYIRRYTKTLTTSMLKFDENYITK